VGWDGIRPAVFTEVSQIQGVQALGSGSVERKGVRGRFFGFVASKGISGMFGQEIGDECVFLVPPFYSGPAIIKVKGNLYALQPEYNNRQHACTADN
jgi:hypothetical protein